MFTPPNDDIKIATCKMCGKDVPCNVNYLVVLNSTTFDQITCTVCYISAKLKRIEKERVANLDGSAS